MFTRKLFHVVCGAVLLGVLATASTGAVGDSRLTYFTFNRSVQLPGVSLPAGTYAFSLPMGASSWNLVRVTNKEGTQVYLTAFTRIVDRPADSRLDAVIMFGETSGNVAPPIKVWFPQGERAGRQFIY
jgi:hypothetical protein